jgi:hypothetical protein
VRQTAHLAADGFFGQSEVINGGGFWSRGARHAFLVLLVRDSSTLGDSRAIDRTA